MRTVSVVLTLLCPSLVLGEDLTVLPSTPEEVVPRKMLGTFLRAEAGRLFAARRKMVFALKTAEEIRKRQKALRAAFVHSLGGFPEKTPLRGQLTGRIQGKGYRLEKVIYESRPGHHVTASLYLPAGKGPFPGVLLPCGHSRTGKASAAYQRACILLARNGMAALCYDPIGQGERCQLLDATGKPAIRGSTTEHTLTGVGALLVGRNTASYRIWDGIRGLDYLASRPEIDGKRLGCTGVSGGGTLTSYLMALDERIVAAAPSCYITSLEKLFATIGPQDAEQNITGQVAFGMDHADYLTMRAPRPTLILAATRDFFDIDGTWDSFREAKLLYGKLNLPERIAIAEFDTRHGFPQAQREAMVRWMSRWLLGKDRVINEGEIAVRKEQDLWCTRTGQVLEDFKGRSVFDLNAEQEKRLRKERTARSAKLSTEQLRAAVGKLLVLPRVGPLTRTTGAGVVQRKGYRIQKLIYTTEPGIRVPALLFEPGEVTKDKPWAIYLHGAGMSSVAGVAGPLEKLALSGQHVLALDVRGLGETAPRKQRAGRRSFFGVDFKEVFLGLHVNRPLLQQRTHDLLAVIALLKKQRVSKGNKFELVGTGKAAPIALHAAMLEPAVQGLTLERCVVSWSAVVHSPIHHDQLTNVVPGVLRVYDLPDLAAALAPRPLTLRSVRNPRGEVLPVQEVKKAYSRCLEAYRKAKVETQLTIE